jgi:hypothetical protein
MPEIGPAGQRPLDRAPPGYAFSAAALGAFSADEEAPENEAAEEFSQEQATAIFPQDEGHPGSLFFVAETAFDCEDSSEDWSSSED